MAGAGVVVATLAAAALAIVGGTVDSAEAQFGVTPPPPTQTLCETTRPAEVDYNAVSNNSLNWPAQVPVTVSLNSVDGDKSSPTQGAITPFSGPYTFSVVLDNTGDPFDPSIDNHPSFHPMSASSPIVITGGGNGSSISVSLPPGCRYLMSVRTAGHELGGSWIRIESDGTVVATSADMLSSDRLPLAQVVVEAFHDFAQVNAQFDIGEPGLANFTVVIEDGGQIAADYFGNPICTNYIVGGGTDPLNLDEGDLDISGMPTIDAANPGGQCLTDATGVITIKYLTAGKYGVHVIPPDNTDWVQTTTIEGTHIIDAWLLPDDPGIGGEFVGDINAASFQAVGFVSPTLHPDPAIVYSYPFTPSQTGGDITGCMYNGLLFPSAGGVNTVPQDGVANLDGSKEPIKLGYVALNDIGNHDSMMALAETDTNGCFRFVDVPQGSYMLTLWDYELLYIIGFYNVTVNNATMVPTGSDLGFNNGEVDMGSLFVLRWFGWSSGYVFYDSGITKGGSPIPVGDLKDGSTQAAANGVRDCLGQNSAGFDYDNVDPNICEAGIPHELVLIRDRDGSVRKTAVTDLNGRYDIPGIWSPLFRFQVIEVSAGALDVTGHSTHDQFDHNVVASQGNCPADVDARLAQPAVFGLVPESCQPTTLGGGLLLASIFQQGKRNEIDFGKISYLDPNAPNGILNGGTGNGGIAGSVVNTVTRVEWAGSLSAAEANEPGLAGATVRLFGFDPACTAIDPVTGAVGSENPDCYTTQLDVLQTDSYEQPGATRNGQTCTMPQSDGTPYAAVNPTFGPAGENCLGSWLLGAHTKDGAWDGGFAFSNLQTGFYVVQLDLPPGYQIVKENDMNVEEGNQFIPAVPPAGCAGQYHYAQLDSAYGSPFDSFTNPDGAGTFIAGSQPVRLCDRRLVRVQPFRDVGLDMMVMTDGMDRTFQTNFTTTGTPVDPYDPVAFPNQVWQSGEAVPMPARFFGLVLDDLQMTANQNALTFGEQQGVASIPIGFYDYTGNLLTTVWTDENGHYEALMPSTYSINRSSPGGVGPRMYKIIVNDPGPSGNNWGYDPAYITNPNVLEAWPGTMTVADTPVLSLAAGPCSLPALTPHLFQVDQVYGNSGSLPSNYTLNGLHLAGADIYFTPQNPDGTLDHSRDILATPYITSENTVPTVFDPLSFYDEMIVDLGALETAISSTPNPLLPGPYQVWFSQGTELSETARNGISFHVLGAGYDLDVYTVPTPVNAEDKVIQATIETAIAGGGNPDLIVVPPRSYRESLVVHAGMVLQGFGPGGLIGVPTEAGPTGQLETPYAFFTGSVIAPFGAMLDDRMFGPWETLMSGITWDGSQGAEVGPAFQVLLHAGDVAAGDPFQIDGFGITSVRATNGAVAVNGYADGLVISNNGFQSNNSSEGGAAIDLGTHSRVTYDRVAAGDFSVVNGQIQPVAVGTGELAKIVGRSDAHNNNVVIRDNRIMQNGGISLAGAISVFNGNTGYRILDNDICGNYSAEYGGGMSHFGYSDAGVIRGNVFENNESFDEGGALMISSEIALTGPGDIGQGTGAITIDNNKFLYNKSGDDGGAIMVLHPMEDPLRIVNNVIADNAATDLGGGIHLFDSSEATIVHNTIANNLSTSSGEDSGGFSCNLDVRVAPGAGQNTCPRSGGITTQPHSGGFAPSDGSTFSDPALQNNIFWHNDAGYVTNAPAAIGVNLVQRFPGVPDLGVYDGIADLSHAALPMLLNPENSVLTVPYGTATSNLAGVDPLFVAENALAVQTLVAPILGQLANVSMVFPGASPLDVSDYHLVGATSPAVDIGQLGVEGFDMDGQVRPLIGPIADNIAPDAGADEIVTALSTSLMFFSTTMDADLNTGIRDIDAQVWASGGISTVLTGAGGLGIAADIDGLDVLSATENLVSFMGDGVVLPAGPAGIGGTFTVDDEDIVHYNSITDTWSLMVDGSAFGLIGGARDIDAFELLPDGTFLVSFAGFATVPSQSGTIGFPREDIVHMVPVTSVGGVIVGAYFEPWMSGGSLGLDLAGLAGDIDGMALVSGGATLLLSMKGTNTFGALTVRDEDVIACTGLTLGLDGLMTCTPSAFLYFDGTVRGLHGGNDVNAVSGPLAG